tara:strand:- start:1772 stop:2041 length:270 start_codon:yes stop_codon:yes gene_type:complete
MSIELLVFTSPSCNPCRRLKPILKEFIKSATELNVQIINTQENQNKARNYRVAFVPTLVWEVNGVIKKTTGFSSLDELNEIHKSLKKQD